MIFLNKVGSFTLVKSICFPANVKRLDRDQIFNIPTSVENDFNTIIDRLKNSSNLKIRLPKAMYIPFKENIYYRTVRKLFKNNGYNDDLKDAKNRGFTKASAYNNVLNDYNGFYNLNKIIADTINLTYTNQNCTFFWKNILDSREVMHNNRYLLFTKDNMLVKVNNINTIKMSNGLNSKNLYMNFMYNMKINYSQMRDILIENRFNLLFTDYKWTFYIAYGDLPVDSKDFFDQAFFNLRRMATGIELDPENGEEVELTDLPEEVIDDKAEAVIMKTIERLDNATSDVNTSSATSEDTIMTVDSEDIINNTIKKASKDEKMMEQVIKVAQIVDASRGIKNNPQLADKRYISTMKRYNDIREKNLSEILEILDEKADNIMEAKKVDGINGNMKEFKIAEMDKQYERISRKNRMDIGESFKSASIPLFMTKYTEKEDTSSPDTKSKLVSYTFSSPEDSKISHSFTVRVPELRDGKFLHINGSDKVMGRQKMTLPIIKVKDRVLLTSYFGKMFIDISRGNISKKAAKFKRYIKLIRKNYEYSDLTKYFDFTPAYFGAMKYNGYGPEFLEISRYISSIKIDEKNYLLLNDFQGRRGRCIIGKLEGNTYYCTINDEIEDDNGNTIDLLDFMSKLFSWSDEPFIKDWEVVAKKKETTTMAFSEATVLSKSTPLILMVLHAFDENLLEVLEILKNEYGLEYKITPMNEDKAPSKIVSDDDGTRLKFSNFVLDLKYNNVHNRILLDYLQNLDLTQYDSLKLDGLIDYLYDSRHIMNMENYRDFFIDPVACKQVLLDIGAPTEYGELLLYANALLVKSDREIPEISLVNERMPSNSEIIQGVLYRETANNYIDWSNKVKRGSSTATFSVEKDAVSKFLLTLPNVEESSKLNPVQHVDKLLTISGKGVSGVNEDRAYTLPKRRWDQSYYGILSDVSPYTKASGQSMRLAVNPNITDMRGYFNEKESVDVKDSEIMSISEALGAFAQRHDSSPRLAMGMSQFDHLVGTEGSEPALVTYGMDEAIASLDSDFNHKMEDDGEVIEMNKRYVKVRYANLKDDKGNPMEVVFNVNKVERNSAKAKYIINTMELNPKLNIKVGKKLHKNDTIAYNKEFYKNVDGDIVFKSGPIIYVALANIQNSFEDALLITEDLAAKLRTKALKRIAVKLGPRYRIVDHTFFGDVKPGDVIMKYSEDTGSEYYNSKIDMDLLDDYLLKIKKSNYDGNLRDIFIYYKLTEKEYEEMDPSILAFMKYVENHYNSKYSSNKLGENIAGYEKNRVLDHITRFRDSKRSKVNGDSVDKGEILIEFFVEVDQEFTIGDKVTIGNTALKGVCSKILPSSKAPTGVKTGRRIDAVVSQYSPLSRMVYSLFLNGILTECMKKINSHIRDNIIGKG